MKVFLLGLIALGLVLFAPFFLWLVFGSDASEARLWTSACLGGVVLYVGVMCLGMELSE